MKPTGMNNYCTESTNTAARRIQDVGKDLEDRTFLTCSATACIPCIHHPYTIIHTPHTVKIYLQFRDNPSSASRHIHTKANRKVFHQQQNIKVKAE